MRFILKIDLLIFLVLFPAGLPAAEFTAPAGLKLPAEVTPGSGWQKREGVWATAQSARAVLEAPAWWPGDRPAPGSMVVLELEYLDNLSRPVRAEVYSGLGTDNPWSELHRFGGTADGTWKKARVPAPADFIFLQQPEKTLRFRLISDSGELQARAFKLTAPLPDEEARYNEETRAWVARVQQRADVDPSYLKLAQSPVLPGDWASAHLVPFSRNWMDLVLPISAPQAGEAGATLKARMFRNELETVQLGVYANGRVLKNVRISAGPFRDNAGKTVASVTVRVAEYSKVRAIHMPNYFVEPFPQRLWPAYPFEVPAGRSHLVYLVLGTAEASAKPGKYATRIRLQAEGTAEVSLPLEVEILPARLLTMEEAGLKLGGCTTGLLPEFELKFLHEYNHNMINIWYAGVRPELSRSGDSFALDWRVMDNWMAAAKRQGISDQVYFLGGNPYGFPRTMHLPRTLAEAMLGLDDRGWRELSFKDPGHVPPQVAPLIVEWCRRFRAHALEKGWPNVVLTPFDEPAKWHQYTSDLGMLYFIKSQFKEQVDLIRQGFPEAQIYGSIHHYYGGIDFLPDVDVFCTNAVAENWGLPDEVRAGGKILWQYSGTTDKSLPAVARYTFGFYFAGHDSRGSLVWAYNWGNRFDTLDGENWMYAWNTPFEVIPAPFMEGLREAWDERRLIETLKQTAREKNIDISGFLSGLFTEIAQERGKGGSSTLNDFWERAKDDLILELWHDRLVEKLLELR